MSIRLIIVSLAWAVMLLVTFANVMNPTIGGFDLALWFVYLAILTLIIFWPQSKVGRRIEDEEDAGWVR
ncbi:MAG: hypothetical protein AAGJ53_02530 [Pseudomonadota bacterium]